MGSFIKSLGWRAIVLAISILLILSAIGLVFYYFKQKSSPIPEYRVLVSEFLEARQSALAWDYGDLVEKTNAGEVEYFLTRTDEGDLNILWIVAKTKDGQYFSTRLLGGTEAYYYFYEWAREKVEKVYILPTKPKEPWTFYWIFIGSGIFTVGVVLFVFYKFVGKQFIEAKKFQENIAQRFVGPKIIFADVAGIDEAVAEVRECVTSLKYPQRFKEVGIDPPKGILLAGPPGTGKTLLAQAVAGEAGVPVFGIAGSEFVQMYVGVGAARVRDLFTIARARAPCVVFIDEIDAVAQVRSSGGGHGGGPDEYRQTTNQLLKEMQGLVPGHGVLVMAATNRLDILDPAILRPGRFDRKIIIPFPDVRGREKIFAVHTKGKPLASNVMLAQLAAEVKPGTTGADIKNIVNEAGILALREKLESSSDDASEKISIEHKHFNAAILRVLYGPERKSKIISDQEKKETAYHEAGHALVAKFSEKLDPVSAVSIIPRMSPQGEIGGFVDTRSEREEDTVYLDKEALKEKLRFCLGGCAAEEITFGTHGSGVEADLQNVKRLTEMMICRWGMGKLLLGFQFDRDGRPIGIPDPLYQQLIWEMNDLSQEALESAKKIIEENRELLEKVVRVLLEKETISGQEFYEVCARGELK